ncbi:protein CHROMATIN REMODELING 35 [Daucus carota subsp. sativus]|uniref:Helicase ATP-binding domain-containing protein n=1 Tax=Daucus carota subsp. sativus TaxID=79200 RepID=A0A166ICU5_DAUCS|nr:PREDICTED: protein CHROMATIN REMODELING 35 [Daucus carota subsp. sativus]
MESAAQRLQNALGIPTAISPRSDFYSTGRKRMRINEDRGYSYPSKANSFVEYREADYLQDLESGKYGSVTEDIKKLFERGMDFLKPKYAMNPDLRLLRSHDKSSINEATNQPAMFVNLDDDCDPRGMRQAPVLIIDSDDDEPVEQSSSRQYQGVLLPMPASGPLILDPVKIEYPQSQTWVDNGSMAIEPEVRNDKGEYVGVEDESEDEQYDESCDGLANIWTEMTFALESSKEAPVSPSFNNGEDDEDDEDDCEHSFILKDDIGYVCRICGVIQKKIETIIEYQYAKNTKNTRTYWYEGRNGKDGEISEDFPVGLPEEDFTATELFAHPRHSKKMRPHQIEGFNFLVRNLVTENPGGCILAHAPGSGKTFMIISFIQSFMAKFPSARPLIILPKGIMQIWKKEFLLWQVDVIPLLDFYSVKADSRFEQLKILKQWRGERSILFLGYQQFSSIVRDDDTSKTTTECQEILLSLPTLLILDEGHTPRNEETAMLAALEKVKTPRKVVLSGTLYQNHVKEVFNILNLVRPKFLRMETSKKIKKRILSRVSSSKRGNMFKKGDNEFYDLVEQCLVKDDNLKRRALIIQELREMTCKVLHYYKGDFLDELPGLFDFTVFLNLSSRQKRELVTVKELKGKFKISSGGSALYVHPELKSIPRAPEDKDGVDQSKVDKVLENLDVREGVKAKFYLNMLRLCESSGEKLLVFSQYLPPLKFLERLTVKAKGWSPGKEIFVITGQTNSEVREREILVDLFNSSPDAKVFFGSIKACGEGISLVGASRIIILDVHLNPSVTRQAIGRAFRPGQTRKVYTYRLVAADSPEEEDHNTSFRKESISKLWFEWNESCGPQDLQLENADVQDCGDEFLQTPWLNQDVVSLYRR